MSPYSSGAQGSSATFMHRLKPVSRVTVGEQVALLELKVIVQEVLRAIPDYALVPGTVIEHTPWVSRGPKSLPVMFTPRAEDLVSALTEES